MELFSNLDFWQDLFSLAALIVAVVVAVSQRTINSQQRLINESVINIERQALLTAKVLEFEKCWKILITNIGRGRAENIIVRFDREKLLQSHIHIVSKEDEIIYPILNLGESFDILFFTEECHGEGIPIQIMWDDSRKGVRKDYFLQVSESEPFGSGLKGIVPLP